MAESNPIGYNDMFSPDAWEKFIANAEKAVAVMSQLNAGLSSVSKQNIGNVGGGANNATGKKTSLDDYKKEEAAINKINVTYEAKIKLMREQAILDKQMIDYKNQQAKANRLETEERKKNNAANAEAVKIEKLKAIVLKSAEGSLNQLKAKLALVSIEVNKMSKAELDGTLAGKKLLAEQSALTNALSKTEQAGGNFHRQVGAYHLALGKLGKGIKATSSLLGELGQFMGFDTEAMERLVSIGSTFSKTLKEVHHAENLKKIATQESTIATHENTVATELNVASTEEQVLAEEELAAAQAATPWGAIIVGALALGAALYGLNAYLTSSSDETKKLAKENKSLTRELTEQNEIIDRRVVIGESEIELMKAQHKPLEEIRKKEHEINAEKEKALLNNIAMIKSNLELDVSKLADIRANDSIYESLLRVASATLRNLGLNDDAEKIDTLIAYNKKERAKETIEDTKKQLDALAKAQADYNSLQAQKIKQDKEITNEEIALAKEANDKIQKATEARLAAQIELDRIAAEEIAAMEKRLTEFLLLQEEIRGIDSDRESKKRLDARKELLDRIGSYEQKAVVSDLQMIEKFHDAGYLSEVEYFTALKLLREKDALSAKKLLDEKYQNELTQLQSLNNAVGKGLDARTKANQDALKIQSDQIDSELSTQASLFSQGLDNQLAYEQRAKAENTQKELAAARKAAKEKKGIELANTYISFLQSYLKDGTNAQSAATKALAQTLIAEGIADAIAGTALEGTEDTGRIGNGGWDGKGGRPWLLHDNERVLTKEQNKAIGDISNDELVQRAMNNDMNNLYSPNMQNRIPQDVVGGKGAPDYSLSLLLNEMSGLRKDFQNHKTTNITVDDQKNIVEIINHNGLQKTVVHKDNIFRS